MIRVTVTGPLITLNAMDVLEEADLDVLFEAFEDARRGGSFVVLTDTSRLRSAPRKVISLFADRLKLAPHLTDRWLGNAIVVGSPAFRFILSTLMVIAPMPTEVKVFATRAEAKPWCAMLLRSNGLLVPAELTRTA